MAVAKTALLSPLTETDLGINREGLVVGGGIAGMTAALALSRQGYPVHLVEKTRELGGNGGRLHKTYKGEDIASYVRKLVREVEADERITVRTGAEITSVDGFVGNFSTRIMSGGGEETFEHGVAVLAVGAREHKPDEYLYGKHEAVLTHLELDALFKNDDPRLEEASDVAFIQCVGSRDEKNPYCSKVCCAHTVSSALAFKEKNPDVNVTVFYRDLRTYGQREAFLQGSKGQRRPVHQVFARGKT